MLEILPCMKYFCASSEPNQNQKKDSQMMLEKETITGAKSEAETQVKSFDLKE